MMQRQNRKHTILRRHVKNGRKHRNHARKIPVREHHALGAASRSGSEDERGYRLRVHTLWQESDALILCLFVRHHEDVFESPDPGLQSRSRQTIFQISVVLRQFAAQNQRRRVAGAGKGNQVVDGAFRIDGYASGARFEDAKVSHAPLRRILADQHHAITGFDTLAGKKSGRPQRQLAHVGIGVLLLAAVTLDAHSDAGGMTLG